MSFLHTLTRMPSACWFALRRRPTHRVERFTANNNAYSNYNGVTVSAQQNILHGFTGRIAYTYSHALDVSSNGGVPAVQL